MYPPFNFVKTFIDTLLHDVEVSADVNIPNNIWCTNGIIYVGVFIFLYQQVTLQRKSSLIIGTDVKLTPERALLQKVMVFQNKSADNRSLISMKYLFWVCFFHHNDHHG